MALFGRSANRPSPDNRSAAEESPPEKVLITGTEEVGKDGLRILWQPVRGANGYHIYTGTADAVDQYKGFTTAESIVLSGLKLGEELIFTVRAGKLIDGALTLSEPSEPLVCTIPVMPGRTEITSAVQTGTGVRLTWKAMPRAEGYYIYAGEKPERMKYLAYAAGNTCSLRLKDGSAAWYAVCAKKKVDGQLCKAQLSEPVFYLHLKPTVPDRLTRTGEDGVTVTWPPVSGCSGYYVYMGAWRDAEKLPYAGYTAAPSWEVKGLPYGKPRWFAVRPMKLVDGKGAKGPVRDSRPFTLLPPPETTVKAAAGTAEVKWAAIPGASHYRVYWRKKGEMTYAPPKETTERSLKVKLPPGLWQIKVRALNKNSEFPELGILYGPESAPREVTVT